MSDETHDPSSPPLSPPTPKLAEFVEFYKPYSPRGAALSVTALLDDALSTKLRSALSRAETENLVEATLSETGYLGSFGAKVRFSYMLGMLSPFAYKELITINNIRNAFAHKPRANDFDMGPTILTVPHVLERVFREAGRSMHDYLDLRRLDPQWRCFFTYPRIQGLTSSLAVFHDERFIDLISLAYTSINIPKSRKAIPEIKTLFAEAGIYLDRPNWAFVFEVMTFTLILNAKTGQLAPLIEPCV